MIGHTASISQPVPPARRPSWRKGRFVVGRDATGCWIVTDERGLAGGIFADRSAAVCFAMAECDCNPGDVCAAPEGVVLSLDTVFDPDWPGLQNRKLD